MGEEGRGPLQNGARAAGGDDGDRFFELSIDLLCVMTFDGFYVRLNPAWERALGWTIDELLARPAMDLVHPADREATLAQAKKLWASEILVHFENRHRAKDGSYRWFQWKAVPDAAHRLIYATVRDVTEQKLLLPKLMFADRLASIGTLAAGTAHEINNPLSFVKTNVELSLEKLAELPPTPELRDVLQLLGDAAVGAERIRRIVRGLRAFSRAEGGDNVAVTLRPVIDLAVTMIEPELRRRARLLLDIGSMPAVKGDETRLGQVFLNLLLNAVQALPEGRPEQHRIQVTAGTEATGRAFVEVADTGSGIAPEVMPRIFDPFFTTKPVGVGTGLGLSICHGIVSELGGEISVHTEVGSGTTFRVSLPPCEPVARTPQPSANPPNWLQSAARVLVVDDEELIGMTLQRLLTGHEVTTVVTAVQAFALLDAGIQFDLILCDLTMGPTGGADFHREIGRRAPAMLERLVFMTGGALDEESARLLDRIGSDYLEKPFDTVRVRSLVRRMARRRAVEHSQPPPNE